MDELKREAWVKHGTLIVNRDDGRLSWDEREMVEQIARAIHGKGD